MEYRKFLTELLKETGRRLGKEADVEHIQARQNSSTVRDGMLIMGEDASVSAVLYLEKAYECFQKGADIEACASVMAEGYLHARGKTSPLSGAGSPLTQWDRMKGGLLPILLNTEWNWGRLERLDHVQYLDLSVCFRLHFMGKDGTMYSMLVSRGLLESWGIPKRELMRQAVENLGRDGYRITPMDEVITMLGGRIPEGEEPAPDRIRGFAVLTNRSMAYGAAGILRKELLKDYAQSLGRNLFLLPSSIHEFLIVADTGEEDAGELNQMVQEVNETGVIEEERLSDHIYYYDMERDEVTSLE